MIKYDQCIQDPKRRGRDNEHVDRHGVGQVVVQKATPSRGGGLGAPWQIPPDRGLADIDAELEQFAMEARCPLESRRIRSRISAFVFDRPERRDRSRQ